MRFYAGTADEEPELPYGVVIARGLEETVPGDHTYYGTLEVRLVHDIDTVTSGEPIAAMEAAIRKLRLLGQAHDPDTGVRVLGATPQQRGDGLRGGEVFVHVIPVNLGLQDELPDHTESIEARTERSFAEYLGAAPL